MYQYGNTVTNNILKVKTMTGIIVTDNTVTGNAVSGIIVNRHIVIGTIEKQSEARYSNR